MWTFSGAQPGPSHERWILRHPALRAAVLLLAVAGSGARLEAQGLPRLPGDSDRDRPTQIPAGPSDRPGARGSQAARPLPEHILAMPGVQEELQVIQRRSQLIIGRANIIRTAVADPSIVDVVQYSPNEIAVIGLSRGSTTLTVWFENDPRPLIYLVRTIADPSIEEQKEIDYGRLERKLADLFPNSTVRLIPVAGKIVVKGQAPDSEEAARILQIVRGEVVDQEGSLVGPQPQDLDSSAPGVDAQGLLASRIVDMLEVPGEFQVMLRVRIAELNRSQLRRLGLDLELLLNNGRHLLTRSLGGIPSTLTGIFENGEISVLLNWLASNGTAKILSEPVLTVLSGHTASFLSGGEFAVPTVVGVDGVSAQTTEFRGFGTSLLVTPTVIDKDLVRMQIVPEFSEVNQANAVNGIPGVDSRRVQTTVQLREGQTIAIAGLLSHQSRTEVTRIPFLSDIPFFGTRLFAAKRANQDETELLVLVTPEIVRPMDPDQVPPVPGFHVTHPTDRELFQYGMTEGLPDPGLYHVSPLGMEGPLPVPLESPAFGQPPGPDHRPVESPLSEAGHSVSWAMPGDVAEVEEGAVGRGGLPSEEASERNGFPGLPDPSDSAPNRNQTARIFPDRPSPAAVGLFGGGWTPPEDR